MAGKQPVRVLHFEGLDEILDEARRIVDCEEAEGTGAWTPAQNIDHVARLIHASVEGFAKKPPLFIRLIGPLFKQKFANQSFGSGLPTMDFLVPADEVTGSEALEHLETAIANGRAQGFVPASPVLGRLTAEQWEQLHCRHAELHFGMIKR